MPNELVPIKYHGKKILKKIVKKTFVGQCLRVGVFSKKQAFKLEGRLF
jgi:hypothetical protein